jgi:lactate dehydrogenase-like 2-hydroxyacid dehydrogenase
MGNHADERQELLLASKHLAPLVSALEPAVKIHHLWQAEDPEAMLKSVGARIRVLATDTFAGADRCLLAALPRLECVASFGVGYETIDVEYAKSRGIMVSNTPGVLDSDVADLALALMLAVCRRIVVADRFVRQGQWLNGQFPLGQRLTGLRLGIAGLGRIGKAVAKRASGFEMKIAYHGRNEQDQQPWAYYPDLVELARNSDILVVLVPGNRDTQNLVDKSVLEGLAENRGILINVSRGQVVEEQALLKLLQKGRLGGAGLDVYQDEPRVPEQLKALESVVLLPHIGSATVQTRHAMGQLVMQNLQAFLRGEPLLTPIE